MVRLRNDENGENVEINKNRPSDSCMDKHSVMTGFKFSAKCDKKCIYSDNLHAFIIIYKVFKVIISVRNKTFAAQKTLKLISKRVGILFLPLRHLRRNSFYNAGGFCLLWPN